MEITGSCPCGAVRYRINGALITTRVCWCRLCQHIGAGSATVNACFPRDAITIEGELRDYRSIALVTAVQELGRLTGVATPTVDTLLIPAQEPARKAGLYAPAGRP